MSERHDVLRGTVQKLRRRIQRLQDRSEKVGEENTKAALIEPLLTALGWDIEELDEVTREYRRKPKDNPVDYALFVLRTPRLFIEAKALDKDLRDRKWISQTLGYATVVGVEWCVLTNGDEYRLYNAHAPVDVEEKIFRVFKITDKEEEKFLLETLELLTKDKMGENLLNLYWKAHFIDRNIKLAIEQMLDNEDASFIRLIRKITKFKASEIKESLKRIHFDIDVPVLSTPKGRVAIKKEEKPKSKTPKMLGVETTDIINAGLIDPPFELEKTYKGNTLRAVINADGSISFDGRKYNSLSMAGGFARKSINNPRYLDDNKWPSTNGWDFWKCRDPKTGKLVKIDVLRKRYIEKGGKVLPLKRSELSQ